MPWHYLHPWIKIFNRGGSHTSYCYHRNALFIDLLSNWKAVSITFVTVKLQNFFFFMLQLTSVKIKVKTSGNIFHHPMFNQCFFCIIMLQQSKSICLACMRICRREVSLEKNLLYLWWMLYQFKKKEFHSHFMPTARYPGACFVAFEYH